MVIALNVLNAFRPLAMDDIYWGRTMRNNSETECQSIYQERNTVIEKTCQKYGLYSSENETNQYQITKNSYEPPLQV